MPSYTITLTNTTNPSWPGSLFYDQADYTYNLGTTLAADEYPSTVSASLKLGNTSGNAESVRFLLVNTSNTSSGYQIGNDITVPRATADAGWGYGSWDGTITGSGAWTALQGVSLGFRKYALSTYGRHIFTGAGESSVTITTTYKAYSITVGSATGGTGSTSVSSASRGSTVTLTATPSAGYELEGWTTTAGTISQSGGNYILTMPTPGVNVTVTPKFKLSVYNNQALTLTQSDLTITATKTGADNPSITYKLARDNTVIATFNGNSYTFTIEDGDFGPHSYKLIADVDDELIEGAEVFFAAQDIHYPVGYYNGTKWVSFIPYYYDGTSWIECCPTKYQSSEWVECGFYETDKEIITEEEVEDGGEGGGEDVGPIEPGT